jgi:transposase
VRLALSAGQAADMRAVPELLRGLPEDSDVVADRGYDYDEVRHRIRAAGGRDHVPTTRQSLQATPAASANAEGGKGGKRNQISVPPELYRQRNLIERCFNRLKHFRRLATRFDKLARNYLSTVALAAIRMWTRFESRA